MSSLFMNKMFKEKQHGTFFKEINIILDVKFHLLGYSSILLKCNIHKNNVFIYLRLH